MLVLVLLAVAAVVVVVLKLGVFYVVETARAFIRQGAAEQGAARERKMGVEWVLLAACSG